MKFSGMFAINSGKSFPLALIIFLHVAFIASQSSSNSKSIDCSTYQTDELPNVLIYDASPENITYVNDSVAIQRPISQAKIAGWPGFECNHRRAVRWVYNLDYDRSGIGDSYSAITREAGDMYNTSSYEFKAEIELQIYTKDLNFVISCMAYDNICDRKSVEVVYNKTNRLYTLRVLSREEEHEGLIKELEATVYKNQMYWRSNRIQNSTGDSECAVKFSLHDESNKYYFQYHPEGDFVHPRSLPDRQNLENAYIFNDHLSSNCVTNYCSMTGANITCNLLEKDSSREYWPVVFFMTNNHNLSRIVHVYHTLKSRNYGTGASDKMEAHGKLKFVWEYSDKRDFLDMEKLPEKVYYNQRFSITCKISPFMFSFGTKISYEVVKGQRSSKELNKQMNFLRVEEPVVFKGYRTATGRKVFESQNFTETDMNLRVYCFAPVFNSSTEWVNISREIVLTVPKLEVRGPEEKVTYLPLGYAFNKSCVAKGTPPLEMTIMFPGNVTRAIVSETVMDDSVIKTISIAHFDDSHSGFYNCVAVNPRGEFYYEFEIRKKSNPTGGLSKLSIILISVFASISVIFLVILAILFARFVLEKEEFRRLTEEAIREFQNGLDPTLVPMSKDEDGHAYVNDSIKTVPYERKYEVPHKHWTIANTLLGAGAYGLVRKGTVEIGSRKSIIAVKTVKCPDDIDSFKTTLLELKIMEHVGYHRHIVKLIAASTEEIHNRNVLIGVEFCANGNLLDYLIKRKKLFNNLVQDGEMVLPPNTIDKNNDEPEHEGLYENLVVTSDISTIDLYKWSYQIASGMDYLESKKVLHADLAARNVLLTEELVVKISDFGLSRDLFENTEYTKQTQVALPWKWMSIESLKFSKFSTKSDVWAFGITLWEIFTLGEEPYSGQSWTEEFMQTLDNGMRLERPEHGTNNLYNKVMMPCWLADPNERIRFSDSMLWFEKAIGLLTSSPKKHDECRDFC